MNSSEIRLKASRGASLKFKQTSMLFLTSKGSLRTKSSLIKFLRDQSQIPSMSVPIGSLKFMPSQINKRRFKCWRLFLSLSVLQTTASSSCKRGKLRLLESTKFSRPRSSLGLPHNNGRKFPLFSTSTSLKVITSRTLPWDSTTRTNTHLLLTPLIWKKYMKSWRKLKFLMIASLFTIRSWMVLQRKRFLKSMMISHCWDTVTHSSQGNLR